jgi:hypothetical protein
MLDFKKITICVLHFFRISGEPKMKFLSKFYQKSLNIILEIKEENNLTQGVFTNTFSDYCKNLYQVKPWTKSHNNTVKPIITTLQHEAIL